MYYVTIYFSGINQPRWTAWSSFTDCGHDTFEVAQRASEDLTRWLTNNGVPADAFTIGVES